MTRVCLDCPKEITRQSKTGRCQSCATKVSRRDPEREARRLAAQKATMQTPEFRTALGRRMREVFAERRKDPAYVEARRQQGQRLRALYDASPEAQALNASKRAIVGRKLRMQRLPWLPEARRHEYENMRDKVGAAEAKRRILASMTPFERQMARVANGAGLVAAFKPITSDHAFTLGGVATGMI